MPAAKQLYLRLVDNIALQAQLQTPMIHWQNNLVTFRLPTDTHKQFVAALPLRQLGSVAILKHFLKPCLQLAWFNNYLILGLKLSSKTLDDSATPESPNHDLLNVIILNNRLLIQYIYE